VIARPLTLARLRRARAQRQPIPAHAPTPTDRAMMRRALELAEQAGASGEVPVGAVVYEIATARVLGEASNTREHARDPAGHAEFLAVQHAARALGDWRLTGCAVAVTLEPCPMCAGLLVNARLTRVVYGADDPKAGACRSLYALLTDPRLNHRAEVVPGVMGEQAAALLRAFFRARRRGADAGA